MFQWKRMTAGIAVAGALLLTGACGSSSDSSSDSSGGSSKSSFCARARAFENSFSDSGSTDLSDVKDQFASGESQLSDVIDSAPADIKSDAQTLLDAYKKANKGIQAADSGTDLASDSGVQQLDDPKVKKASDNVSKYLKDKCGISSGSDSGGLAS